ncbi:MAG: enoyl-CoA hydratase-related protein, partial [Acidimicrobiales bacterium]
PAERDSGGLVSLRIFRCLKPVIGAINGPAVGVGITMTLPMDVRMIAEGAKVGFVFGARGIVAEAASSWFLPRIVGITQALEWCLTARVFPAEEALAGGLVRSVHPPDRLLPAAQALAAEMAANVAPVSATIMRQMLWRMLGAAHPMEAHRVDSLAIAQTGALADAAEGVAAFQEKRPARWQLGVPRDLPPWHPWWEEPTYAR